MKNLARSGGLVGMLLMGHGAMAQETTDWSGFYAGVFAGYGLDTEQATSTTSPPVTAEVDPGEFVTIGSNSFSERFEALLGGVQAGYNYQAGNVVMGVEGSFGLGGLNKGRGQSLVYNLVDGADFSNNAIDSRSEFSVDWLTTFAGRLGMQFDGWLVYGKAGVALADISAQSSSSYVVDSNTGEGLFDLPNGTYTSSATTQGVQGGVVVGLGLEKMVTDQLSLGVEYSYVKLGNIDTSTAGLPGLGGGGGSETFSANLHTLKASLNYHF